jgi:hypothetical protein
MRTTKIRIERNWIVGVLGAATLLASPIAANADQGKWWDPQARQEVRDDARFASRGKGNSKKNDRNWGNRPHNQSRYVYRVPAWRGGGRYTYEAGPRFHRVYRGYPVYRDQVWVTTPSWGHRRGTYGWRYWVAPTFYYPTHVVYVRPVRFYVSAQAIIGGVSIGARYADPIDVYGCNFCDARFETYGGYARHVHSCVHAPHDYRVVVQQWDERAWDDDDDQGGWDRDDRGSRDW